MEALAKIITQEGKEFYVKEGVQVIHLGREKVYNNEYFQIGDSNTISKRHAKIFWDNIDKNWKIENLSKNKIYVNFDSLMQSDKPRVLNNMSPILISKMKLFFLLPRSE